MSTISGIHNQSLSSTEKLRNFAHRHAVLQFMSFLKPQDKLSNSYLIQEVQIYNTKHVVNTLVGRQDYYY